MTAPAPVLVRTKPAFDVIVMSASAGGVEAVMKILGSLPSDFAVPIIVVLHHAKGRSHILAGVLSMYTRMRVAEADDGIVLAPASVYLAPADRHITVTPTHSIASTDGRHINFLRSSSELLLQSVATVCGPRAIAVILSGTGRNGAFGAKALHDAGGIVLAQDKATSLFFGMPEAAIEAGAVNEVLPLQAIGPRLVELARAS